ncbi:MAG: DnaJ C-terminal domain-containing protein [bacterium]
MPRDATCERCDGKGAEPGTSAATCPTCNGQGQVVMGRGYITMTTTCPRCRGRRKIIATPCTGCSGSGQTRRHEAVHVKVPAGIDEGNKLRLEGKGQPAPEGGDAGDLFVVVHVKEHDRLERHQADLLGELELDYVQACLGAELDFEGIDGPVRFNVPAGTQPGELLRAAGHGMPHLDTRRGRGDLHLRVSLRVPTVLTERQRELLEALREATAEAAAD